MIFPQKGTNLSLSKGFMNFVLPVALGRSFGSCGGGYWQHVGMPGSSVFFLVERTNGPLDVAEVEWSERLLRSWAQWKP